MIPFSELLGQRVTISAKQSQLLEQHYTLLEEWNKKLNLTAIRTMDEAVTRHYAESVWLGQRLSPVASAVDVGSGGGFPGIPAAIVRPEIQVTLVESHQRKAVFLSEASRELFNVHVLAKRIEAVEQRFDVLLARAVNWEDFWVVAPRIAASVALLVGKEHSEALSAQKNVSWELPSKLPWGENRYLLVGTFR